MKRILILLGVLAVLVGLVVYQRTATRKTMTKARHLGVDVRELLLPDLNVPAVQKLRLKDTGGEVNLEVSGDKWIVKERDGYPAAFDKIKRVVTEISEQKTSGHQPVGKSAWGDPKVKVLEPGGKDDAAGQGLLVEFQDAKGNVLDSMILGANIESSGGRGSDSPFGGSSNLRFVRLPKESDKETVWMVNNTFYDLQPKPADWIDKSFIDVQKLKEIEVTAPNAADSWKAARKDEQSAWALADAKSGEEFDESKASVSGLLSNPTFNDVLTKDKVTADFMKDAVKARLTTFEGFAYTVQVVKKGKDSSDEKYYLTVAVSADIPRERAAGKDEKEEDKKKKDEEFKTQKKTLEDKLAREKKAEGWTYEVSSYTVTALMKKRSEVLKEKPASPTTPPPGGDAAKPAAPSSSPAAGAPLILPPGAGAPIPEKKEAPAAAPAKTPITVTTPPVSVPPLPKTEIKPAPAPNENPAKPGAPAPVPPATPQANPAGGAKPPAAEKK